MNQETEVAAVVVAWLRSGGWEVYQEVETGAGRCDIVAVRGAVRWGIEVKVHMNLEVMEQARRQAPYFHHVSIAVPAPRGNMWSTPRPWVLAGEVARVFGFGVLRVLPHETHNLGQIKQDVLPRLNRRAVKVRLHEEQKTWAQAGTNAGGHYTRFAGTCQRLVWYVQRTPGQTLRQCVERIDHHYSSIPSATGALAKYIRDGVIAELQLINGKVYPVGYDKPIS